MRFIQKGAIVICYVDNCLLFAQTSKLSKELFASLNEDFLCADEVEADGHLGVEIKTTDGV